MIHVACAADARYAPYSATMLHSLLAHNSGHSIHIHYLHPPEFPAALKKRLQRLAENGRASLRFHEIGDARVIGLPPLNRVARIPWYRVLLPELLPELDRILYLDADTLVTGDLGDLWRTDLQGHPLGAVFSPPDSAFPHHLAKLGLARDTPYFNSGVLLMDLRAWRVACFTERVCEIARRSEPVLTWADQDALNVVFHNDYLPLHPRWNCLNSFYFYNHQTKVFFPAGQVDDAIRQPMILHFEGSGRAKPWHFLNQHPFRQLYLSHLRATGWPARIPEGITLRSLAARFLPATVRSRLRNVMRSRNFQQADAQCQPRKPELHVACAADARYAPYSGAMIHSLLAYNGAHSIHIHYLHPPEFPAALKRRLQRLAARGGASLRFHEIADGRVAGLSPFLGVLRIPWYRVLLPELLPELDRILYLDADTLVTGDLDELWQMDLQGHPLGAVRNPHPVLEHRLAELGLTDGTPYFNSGVLLMDLRAWRGARFTERVCEVSRRGDRTLMWPDQDALNIVFHNDYLQLEPRWNCLNTFHFWREWTKGIFTEQQMEVAVRQPAIVHFEGQSKPWHYFARHPFRERYRSHLRASGLPLPWPEDATLGNIVRRHTQWMPDPMRAQFLSFLARTAALWSRAVSKPLAPPQ